MRETRVALLGVLAGAAVTFVGLKLAGAAAPPAVPSGVDVVATESPRAAPVSSVEQQAADPDIAGLTAEVRDLRRRLDEVLEAVASRSPANVPSVDADTLATAVEAAIRRHEAGRYAHTSIDALRRLAMDAGQTDLVRACELMELVVARHDIPADRRSELERELGVYQRAAGNFDAAERTLRTVMDRTGLTSIDGQESGRQLAFTLAEGKRPQEALQLAEALVQHARGNADQLLDSRQTLAEIAVKAGDASRARSEYAALIRDYSGEARLAAQIVNWRNRLSSLQ